MRRRTFLTGAATVATVGTAGCLGGESEPQTDEEHVAALRGEIEDRGVELLGIEHADGIVEVEHGYDEDPNDALANVAMAFVDRIADDWDVERLDGYLRDDDNDWAWHAESEWAESYADGDIGPEEYGARLSETLSRVLEVED